ncbi:MAG TPA: methyltransferase domain-containing protein [Planctomycetota bacterium]|nr:methyltransferase domain-containing protein [Planctomycetota bacterium]
MDVEVRCGSCADYAAALATAPFARGWQRDGELAQRQRWWRPRLRWPGHCRVCARATMFTTTRQGASATAHGLRLDFRNGQRCARCRLFARQRKVVEVLDALLQPGSRLYATEARTRLFAQCARRYQGRAAAVVGSEYLGAGLAPGALVRGVRHEDVQRLSFASASFDLLVSCDVLEHVPDFRAALREFARVLQPGGRLLLTVPFFGDRDAIVQRAELRAGAVVPLLPPQRHTNPLDRAGSLVFWDFGGDLLAELRSAGFATAAAVLYWSEQHGHLGVPSEYFVAER